jgi:hypothetical protein
MLHFIQNIFQSFGLFKERSSFVPCRIQVTNCIEHIFQVSRDTRSMLAVHRHKPHQDSTPTPTTTNQLTNIVALLMI